MGKGKGVDGGEAGRSLRRSKWINRQLTRVANVENLNRLFQTINYHIGEMNAINLVTALHRVTKLAVSRDDFSLDKLLENAIFRRLTATVVSRVESCAARNAEVEPTDETAFSVQCMSVVCWSCAALRLQEDRLWTTIAELASPKLGELKPYELSNMTWAYAKVNMGTPDFFLSVSHRMMTREPGDFSLQCLSMVAWSFATAKIRDPVLFSHLAKEIIASSATAKPQEIANTLWAYAKNRCQEAQLFHKLGDVALSDDLLWTFKPQELSNTVWSFATVGIQHPPLFRRAMTVAIAIRRQLSPQNSANILWALAKLQVCSQSGLLPVFFELLGASSSDSAEVSAILWAAVRKNQSSGFGGASSQLVAKWFEDLPQGVLEAVIEVSMDAPGFFEYLTDGVDGEPQDGSVRLFRAMTRAVVPTRMEDVRPHVYTVTEHMLSRLPYLCLEDQLLVSDSVDVLVPLYGSGAPGPV